MTGDVGVQGRFQLGALLPSQLGWALTQNPTAPCDPSIVFEMEKGWKQAGSCWKRLSSANRAIPAATPPVALQAVTFSSPEQTLLQPELRFFHVPPPLLPPPHPQAPTPPLTQVRVVAGKELPEFLQAGFLPHRHGGSTRSVLVGDSGDERNDGPEGEGLLLLKGGPHAGLLCGEQRPR